MQRLALLPVLSLVLAACSDAPLPSEPEVDVTPVGRALSSTQSGYTAIDLGTLGDVYIYSTAYGINNFGQVVGVSFEPREVSEQEVQEHAFLWDAVNGMQDLGPLGGTVSAAIDINDAGQVVGQILMASGDDHAFLWDAVTGVQDLGTLGGHSSQVRGINAGGQAVGFSRTVPYVNPSTGAIGSGDNHAFLWDAVNGMQDLGTLGGSTSAAYDINDTEQVVGNGTSGAGSHAFLWEAANGMQDLGTLGGTYSYSIAQGINNVGQVVGYSFTPSGEGHAFLWDAVNGMQDLGTLGGTYSYAYDINDAGQVVGQSYTASEEPHAFVWDAANGMEDLGTLGGFSSAAYGINDAGQIVGRSSTALDQPHATLWRVLTPAEQLEACAAQVTNLEGQGMLNQGQTRSLVAKINGATAALNRGKNTPAVNKLEAFQNEVNAYIQAGKLTPEQGNELISCVLGAIDRLGS